MNTALILSLAAIGVAIVLFILLLVQNHKIAALREARQPWPAESRDIAGSGWKARQNNSGMK